MDFFNGKQVLLVTVGLIGSGKSTLANAFEASEAGLVRCNQDDLGDRRAVENLARKSLRQGKSVCVDRSNFDEKQRQTWINIAREFPGTAIWALYLDVERIVCLERLQNRTDHPTIKDFETAEKVLNTFSSQLTKPCPCEGFDVALQYTDEEDDPSAERNEPEFSSRSVDEVIAERAQTMLVTLARISARKLQDRQSFPRGLKQLVCKGHPKGKGMTAGGSSGGGRGRGSPHRRGGFQGRGGSSSSSSRTNRGSYDDTGS